MAKFNRGAVRPAVSSPVKTDAAPTGHTYEGAGGRDARFAGLVHRVALQDPVWLLRMLTWLRTDGNLRSAPIVAACEMVKARLDAGADPVKSQAGGGPDVNRAVIDAVCRRADEPGELLAYWTSTHGRAVPKPVKRGLADAVQRLYDERSLLKYDTATKAFRFADVIDLVHPTPAADRPWQGDLFRHALDRRHDRGDDVPGTLSVLAGNAGLRRRAAADPAALLDAEALRAAGMTWEDALSLAGSRVDKARLWEAVIPAMGVMALARNLRNFDEAGVRDEVAATVAAKLADPEVIARSRMFPFRFLAAHKAAPSLRWAWPLEQALNHSLANVPELGGRTLILVDRSGSMFGRVSEKSGLNRADSAALFGTALALRAASADLVQFGTGHRPVPVRRGESLLKAIGRFGNMGGTDTAEAVRANYRGHDRVVIVTDEQAWAGPRGADPTGKVPAGVPVYTWNLAGYRYGHGPSGEGDRHTFGGLSDAAFRLVNLIEMGRSAHWPWEQNTS